MEHIADVINLDIDAIRAKFYSAWLKTPGVSQGDVCKQIGLSDYAFRRFLDGKGIRCARTTKLKILSWIESQEKGETCKNVNVN